jgi:membrane fusion protein (multidrug efflux system)
MLIDNKFIGAVFLVFVLFSCKENDTTSHVSTTINDSIISSKKVKTLKPTYNDFHLELKITGKIYAHNKVDLKFKLVEKISSIYVTNGKKVRKGQILAKQENNIYSNKVVKAKEQLERAKIDVEDILIGFNHSFKDSSNVPKTTLNMAKNRSNYNTSISNLNDSKIELSSTVLRSPINGIVANLETKNYSYPDNTKPFCTIIDNSVFEVEFSVIEDDYVFLTKGQPIEVSTLLSEETSKGSITEINPTVDENGMIKVKGLIKDASENIIDGMNINIIIKKVIPDKIYVPKESVVLRDNKKVIFTYEEGKAIWNYVETSFENYDFVVIEKGIKKDDEIIYSGNVNLAHNSSVLKENE